MKKRKTVTNTKKPKSQYNKVLERLKKIENTLRDEMTALDLKNNLFLSIIRLVKENGPSFVKENKTDLFKTLDSLEAANISMLDKK